MKAKGRIFFKVKDTTLPIQKQEQFSKKNKLMGCERKRINTKGRSLKGKSHWGPGSNESVVDKGRLFILCRRSRGFTYR